MYSKILIASDGSEGALRALSTALDLAWRCKAELHMVCVEELPRFATSVDEVIEEKQEAERRFGAAIEQARAMAKARRVRLEPHILAGHVVPAVVDFVQQQGFELLVVGFMGHSALYNRLIGSTTDRLVELAPCSVMVVK